MLRNLLTVGGWIMLSRILGLVRDQLLAAFLGAGPVQDAYQIAFRLPNMFRRLFGEGAFNAAFVPLFTARYETQGRRAALTFAGQAFSGLLVWLALLTLLGEIFMPWLIDVIAPGFRHETGARFSLAVTLTRVTFPYMIFICAAALVAGILNGRNRFGAAAAAYVTFNVIGILAILSGALLWHNVALVSAWGITLSGIVQLGALLWATRRAGLLPRLSLPCLSEDMRLLLRRMAPGLIGSGVTQLNLTVDTIIATLLPAGSISWLYFADRVNQLPLGILGAALGTTLLPLLTRHAAAEDRPAMQASLNRALDYALLLTLPATMGLLALAPSIIGALFGYGHFSASDVWRSSQCLRAYALGLPAFILVKLFAPGFFAQGDTVTPVRIGFATLALNLLLNLLLYRPLQHMGPPLASALAAIVNMIALGTLLYRRAVFRPDAASLRRAGRIAAASLLMAGWACLAEDRLSAWLGVTGLAYEKGLTRLTALGGVIFSSALLYALALDRLGVMRLSDIAAKIRRKVRRSA